MKLIIAALIGACALAYWSPWVLAWFPRRRSVSADWLAEERRHATTRGYEGVTFSGKFKR